MFYLAAAGFGLSTISNLLQSKEQGKLAIAQSKASIQRLGALKDQLSLQSAQDARNTSAALFNLQQQQSQQESQVQLQSASTGTIGASVQDALSTIAIVTDRQEASEKYNYSAAEEERYRQLSGEASATGKENKANLGAAISAQQNVLVSSALKGASTALGLAGESQGASYADAALKGESYVSNVGTSLTNFYSSYLK